MDELSSMNRYFALLAIAALLITGCKSTQSTTSSPKVSKNTLSDGQRAEVTFLFFNANKEKLLGNYNNAADLFAEVIRKDPNNAAAMYELANIYGEQKKFTDALFFSKSAYLIDPSNPWYTMTYADVLQKNKKFDESATVIEKLVNTYPDRVDYYYEWASALLYAEKPAEAIKVYDKL